MRFGSETFQQLGREPRFTDPGLAADQDHLAFAGLCPGPAPQQEFGLFLPPDEGGQAGRMHRLETALHGTRPQRRPGPHRPGDALEVLRAEVLQLKEIAEKPSGGFSDDDGIRRGGALQACCEVRCFTHDPPFLRLPGTDKIADHDQPSRDANPHAQPFRGRESADCFDERQSRADSTLVFSFRFWGVRFSGG
jgi:hypothetical protein